MNRILKSFDIKSSGIDKVVLALIWLCLSASWTPAGAQECDYVPEGKIAKLLDNSKNKKKYDSKERTAFLERIVEDEPACLEAKLKLGITYFKRAKNGSMNFSASQNLLNELVEMCAEYHSDPFYYLGAMAYANGQYEESLNYFDQFLNFPIDGPAHNAKDYDKKYNQILETRPNVEFFKDFYAGYDNYNPERVEGVSGGTDEYLPTISPDSELLFYTRKVQRKAKGDYTTRTFEEFTLSRRNNIGERFDDGSPLPPPFNLGTNYGGATLSVDNKELFVACKNPVAANKENIDIYRTTYTLETDPKTGKKGYKWSALELLGPNINGELSWDSQPSLSADGKLLYFATVRPECITNTLNEPSTDIFCSERQADGTWGPAKSIGGVLNTAGNEKAPYMHSDSKTLYFASTGHKGGGGYDIFYTRQDKDGNWSPPKNIGNPINTPDDEHGLIVSADGEKAYFASRKEAGARGFDIYGFELPEVAKPEKVVIVKGHAMDESGEPNTKAEVKIEYVDTKEVQKIAVNSDDGSYAAVVNLDQNSDVLLSVEQEGTAFNTHVVVDKTEKNPPAIVKVEVAVKKLAPNTPFVINDIVYSTNSADIDRVSLQLLNRFAQYLKKNPRLKIEIRGHTDNVGSESDNLALSMDRAFEVKGYLEKQGIAGSRIKAQGFGEKKPLKDNSTEAGRRQNRRTEFVVTGM